MSGNDPEPGEPGWATYEPSAGTPDGPGPAASVPAAPSTPYPGYDAAFVATPRRSGASVVVPIVLALVVLVIAVATIALSGLTSSEQVATFDPADGRAGQGGSAAPVGEETRAPKVLTVDGYADLVTAVDELTGSTMAYRVVLYPTYVSLDVPVDATTQREQTLYWDGALRDSDARGTARQERFDLASIDAQLFTRLLRRAKSRVDDPMSTYIIIEGAVSVTGEDARILAYASNEFSEGAYVAADLTGAVNRVITY